ncbi:hypothetical protein F8O07_07100 [Pseudoclavibacter sp. CFCC 13796]|nr:hypothetical protein F8O07_07100 [Pseudoclavibacter sp. CFCC 13796]
MTDSGALKLADSAVAPLVAAARGYSWLQQDAVKTFVTDKGMGPGNTKTARQLRECVADTGAMVMPWFRVDRVLEDVSAGRQPHFDALQYRPTRPRTFEDGRVAKYELRLGDPSVIDVHPATPKSWFEPGGTARIMVTEGILKADAAVTAMLNAADVDPEILASSGLPEASRVTLTEAMEAVPVKQRTLVLALVGVGNWHRNALEFSAIPLKDTQTVLAFDADAATNINVWTQLDRLTTFLSDRGARVAYVDLAEANLADVQAGGKGKLGIDDALAKYCDWADLVAYDRLQQNLPARPKDDVVAKEGAWRVTGSSDSQPAGTKVQVCHEVQSEFGGSTGTFRWSDRFPFAGRMDRLISKRSPTSTEIESGVYERGWAPKDSPELEKTAVLELGWIDPVSGDPKSVKVEGPAQVIAYQEPRDWARPKSGVDLPMDVFSIPEFPPAKEGREWLNAVKAHRAADTQVVTAWDTLGWVPVPGADYCAFIAGNQVVTPIGEDQRKVISAVSEVDLPGASRFGLRLPEGEVGSEEWKEHVRRAVRDVFAQYVFSGVWSDRGTAAVVLAAGLRPYVPVKTHSVVYLQGPPGKGKSWTASAIASFHQAAPGLFDNNSLPSGANSTAFATEIAVSKANLWIVDDIAPTLDRRKADEQSSKIADLIRSIHNSASRQRGNGNGGLAKTRTPKALLVLTAENNAQLRSVRDRTLEVTFGDGSLSDGANGHLVEEVSGFRDTNPAPATLAGALVQYLQHVALQTAHGWEDTVHTFKEIRSLVEDQYRERMQAKGVNPANVARKAKIGADLGIGLQALAHLMAWVGGLDRELAAVSAQGEDTLFQALGDLTASNALGQQLHSPGATLVESIRGMLLSGEAYLDSAAGDGTPPLGGDASAGNAQLGWMRTPEGEWRPRGRYMIGVVAESPDDTDERVALIVQKPTASLALRFDPTIGHGSDGSTIFRNLYTEKLVHPHYQNHLQANDRVSVQIRRSKNVRFRGVPLKLSTILDGGAE